MKRHERDRARAAQTEEPSSAEPRRIALAVRPYVAYVYWVYLLAVAQAMVFQDGKARRRREHCRKEKPRKGGGEEEEEGGG